MRFTNFTRLISLSFFITLSVSVAGQGNKLLKWDFPINRTHAGMLLGNGRQGLMVWGKDTLHITVAHAGFWDRRGGNNFTERVNYEQFKKLVQKKDEASLKRLFSNASDNGLSINPQQLSAGLVKIAFPKNYKLQSGDVNLQKGIISIRMLNPQKKVVTLLLQQSVQKSISWVELPAELQGKVKAFLVPMYELNKQDLTARGILPPETWTSLQRSGFTQSLPSDAPLSMMIENKGNRVSIATSVGYLSKAEVSEKINKFNPATEILANSNWWKSYWNRVSEVRLDDPVLQEIADYGLYKQACSTPPHGLACTLQGPFMEEYALPPWSSDYHFNINEQLIYTPALASNAVEHFDPLIRLIDSLMPVFQKYGENFFSNKKAYLIPHAVDDRGQAIGGYINGSIDHATTAWVAYMLWQHYLYSGDKETLRRITYPLLKGAFEGFNTMIEETRATDGKVQLSLPISVSPEYGDMLEGIGKNSSFQLAAFHKVLQILPEASLVLNEPVNERWNYVETNLPPFSIIKSAEGESNADKPVKIGLWEGQDLAESHRHHSHLASIYPFESVNYLKPPYRQVYEKSYWSWVNSGMGAWAGWSFGWASMLHGRTGRTEAAVSLLHYWRQNFVNEGRGTLHHATNTGMSVFSESVWPKEIFKRKNSEIMQIDAGFGALSAVLDLLVRDQFGIVNILPNKHWNWKNISFKRVRSQGGFLISAEVKDNVIERIQIESTLGGKIKLNHSLGNRYTLDGVSKGDELLELDIPKGKTVVLKPVL
ncbi:MAG TPA: hypothetical protein VGB63_13335 [Pedobacter sp.]|jgi:hypothetical protein